MAEPSTEEGVAHPIEDHKVENTHSSSQQPRDRETFNDPPVALADTNPDPGTNRTTAPPKGNGAAAEASVPAATTETETPAGSDVKSKADNGEGMTQKPPASPVKRLAKASNPVKLGSTAAAKAGSVGASVKKILSSGTFGTSQAKLPAASKPSPSMSSSTKTLPTPTVKKTPSGTSVGSVAKPGTATTPAPARRTSMVPPAAKAFSSSTNSRPSASTAPAKAAPVTGTTRASVTSPTNGASVLRSSTGSGASRPRASVSEGVPAKKPVAPRPSLPAGKPPAAGPGIRPLRTATSASISSIKEVKEDSKAIQELEAKYKEAASSLESNLEKIKDLEAQVESTKATLASTEADRDEKQRTLLELQESNHALEKELQVTQAGLEGHKGEKELGEIRLLQVKEELKTAEDSVSKQAELVTVLQQQIRAVEAELASAKEAIVTSNFSYEKAAAEAASVGREALLKAQADLKEIKAESDALAATQSKAQAEAVERIKALEGMVGEASGLSAEIQRLKQEKDDAASKLSEVEVEVLELRETTEKATDEREKVLARLKTLEQDLAAAGEASAAADEAAKAKDEAHNSVLENLKALESQLATALESHNQAHADLLAKEEEHTEKVAEIERFHAESSKAAAEHLQRVTADLEDQEAKYASQLDKIKSEHTKHLEQAFQKAKSEAGSEHSQDLQNLRAQSQATIEQLRLAHQVALDETRASHEEVLETQVKALDKQISSLNVELKATQDDLAKAKAGLEAALSLEGTLRSQLEQKDAESAAANPPIDQSEEVARLTKELANAKDDLTNISEAFNASKESFQQISENHQTELEAAATARAAEVTKLRAAHEEASTVLQKEHDELVSRISELEVELATIKATTEAQPSAAPLSPRKDANGALPGSPAVTKEELQRMHEAHNLKLYELEASHEQTVKGLAEQLDAAMQQAEEQRKMAERLQMEVNFAEQTAEENEDELQQLRDEIEHLKALQTAG